MLAKFKTNDFIYDHQHDRFIWILSIYILLTFALGFRSSPHSAEQLCYLLDFGVTSKILLPSTTFTAVTTGKAQVSSVYSQLFQQMKCKDQTLFL